MDANSRRERVASRTVPTDVLEVAYQLSYAMFMFGIFEVRLKGKFLILLKWIPVSLYLYGIYALAGGMDGITSNPASFLSLTEKCFGFNSLQVHACL
jgi:glycerol uptake facilitator-like aquaporin